MTRIEALQAMEDKTIVIYTGKGSLGRSFIAACTGQKQFTMRGSMWSIGQITKIKQTKAIVYHGRHTGTLFHIRDLFPANEDELRFTKSVYKKYYPCSMPDFFKTEEVK